MTKNDNDRTQNQVWNQPTMSQTGEHDHPNDPDQHHRQWVLAAQSAAASEGEGPPYDPSKADTDQQPRPLGLHFTDTPKEKEKAAPPKDGISLDEWERQREAARQERRADEARKSEPAAVDTLDSREQRITALMSALEQANQYHSDALSELADSRAENGDLRSALQNTRIALVAAQNSAIDGAKAVLALEADLTNAQNARADAERDLEAAHADLATAARTEAAHQDVIAAWRRAWDVLERERDASAADRDAYKAALANALSQIADLKHGETLARQAIDSVTARYTLMVQCKRHHATRPWWWLW
jgi:chromosome segregation ATPase